MFTRKFWKQAAERAAKTGAQALLVYFGGDVAFNAWQADWPTAAGIASGALALSVLTSLATSRVGEPDSPSAVKES